MPSDRQVIPTYKLLLVMYRVKIKIAMNKYFRVPGLPVGAIKLISYQFIPINSLFLRAQSYLVPCNSSR